MEQGIRNRSQEYKSNPRLQMIGKREDDQLMDKMKEL